MYESINEMLDNDNLEITMRNKIFQ